MSYIKVRDRKLLVLFDFFIQVEDGFSGIGGCPFVDTEFERLLCSACCGVFFGTRHHCPCFRFADPIGELKRLLVKEGYIDVRL